MLQGIVEIDDGFFGSPSEGKGKRGRGTDKTPAVIGLSLDEKGRPGFVKAKVLSGVNGDAIAEFAEATIRTGGVVKSDGLPAYRKLASKGYIHVPENFDPDE